MENDQKHKLITAPQRLIAAHDKSRQHRWVKGNMDNISVQTIVVDGAWKKNAKTNQWEAAIAWKNVNNDPNEEAVTRIFATSAVQTEAYAILKALSDMEWRTPGLIIKTDNLEVIRALQVDSITNKNIDSIIRDIRRIANSYIFVSCVKVSREEVRLAHHLATLARKS